MLPADEPRGPVGRATWEQFASVLTGVGEPELLGDYCRALDEQAALMVAVRRGEASAGDRACLRVLDDRVDVLRGKVSRAAAWATFTREDVSDG